MQIKKSNVTNKQQLCESSSQQDEDYGNVDRIYLLEQVPQSNQLYQTQHYIDQICSSILYNNMLVNSKNVIYLTKFVQLCNYIVLNEHQQNLPKESNNGEKQSLKDKINNLRLQFKIRISKYKNLIEYLIIDYGSKYLSISEKKKYIDIYKEKLRTVAVRIGYIYKLNAESKIEELYGIGYQLYECHRGAYEFEGEFDGGKLSGKGKVMFSNGMIWEGCFSDIQLKYGQIKLSSGEILNCQINKSGVGIQGFMNYSREGNILIGTFKENQLQSGKILWCNGRVDEGEFIENHLVGKGKSTFTDGSVHEGTWSKDQLFLGKLFGKKTYPDGQVYEGEFCGTAGEDYQLCAQGKITKPDGETLEGSFSGNRLNGFGKRIFKCGMLWEGKFDCNKLYGGVIVFPDGRRIQSEYLSIMASQVTTTEMGGVLEGYYDKKGCFHGMKTCADGTVKTGVFKYGPNYGEWTGKKVYFDGRVEEGQFVDDILVKKEGKQGEKLE